MAQKEIEMILARQLASYYGIPIFIVDPEGTLVYYNEPAESILGTRFEETGDMPISQWSTVFELLDEEGRSISISDLPPSLALSERKPVYGKLGIRDFDGQTRRIEVTAIPLLGQADRFLGVIAFLWEKDRT